MRLLPYFQYSSTMRSLTTIQSYENPICMTRRNYRFRPITKPYKHLNTICHTSNNFQPVLYSTAAGLPSGRGIRKRHGDWGGSPTIRG